MKNPLLAVHHWLQTDIHGNVPDRFMSGNMHLETWQLQLFAVFMLGIAVVMYVALAAAGSMPWLPF